MALSLKSEGPHVPPPSSGGFDVLGRATRTLAPPHPDPMTQTVNPMSRHKGWDYSSASDPAELSRLAELAAQIVGRPDFQVHVLTRWNPDAMCVLIRRDNGRGATPRAEGLAVVAYEHEGWETLEQQVCAAALYLSTAEVRESLEAVEMPWVSLLAVTEVN